MLQSCFILILFKKKVNYFKEMSEISYPLSFLPLLISILQFTEDLRNLCFVFGSYWMAEKRGEVVKEGTAFASFFFFCLFQTILFWSLFCFVFSPS